MRVTAQPRFPMTFQREFQRLWSTAFPAASVYGERSFISGVFCLSWTTVSGGFRQKYPEEY